MKMHKPHKYFMRYQPKLVALQTLIALLWLKESNCLRISSIEVPAAAWNGSQVTFSCNYVLAPEEQLYSVKWYKNYVEFYRFQPAQSGQEQTSTQEAPAGAGQVGQNLNLNRADEAAGARHEFELDGINLDLSKSNATQVHLRQVNLSSEATFKCEVSADSPTFATVSAERQLKVYVLPKLKLSLSDNSGSLQQGAANAAAITTLKPAPNNEQPSTRTQNNAKQPIYQLNDLLNFTCVAGPSRPAASLSWFLNDEPIMLANSSGGLGGAGLEASEISNELRVLPNQLAESRSTLVLRLQASQLKILRRQTAAGPVPRTQPAYSSSLLPLKLSCLSRLSVEFSSEASVQVSNGQPPNSKSNSRRQEFVGSVPVASSLRDDGESREQQIPAANRFQFPEHASEPRNWRWPPSELAVERQQRFSSTGGHADALTEAWMGPGEERAGSTGQENKRPQRARHNNVVWTQRQLRAQAEHIDKVLRRSRPNELEAPSIEARSIRRERTDSPPSEPDFEREPTSEPDEEERTTASPPSIVISSNQFGAADEPSSGAEQQSRSRELSRDYELDELVNFTCRPATPSGLLPTRQAADDPPRSVQIKWFINNQEIAGNQVDNFDGRQFHTSGRGQDRAGPKQRAANWLLVEFSSSLMQLKELNLKCRTVLAQPLIEYESSQVISLSASPFIQAAGEQQLGQRGPTRASMFTVREPQQRQRFGDARFQSSPGADQAGQQRQRANVIRMRQSQLARSHSANNHQLNPFVVCFCLAVGLLASGLWREHIRQSQRAR